MTGDQGWGIVFVILGICVIAFRRLFYVGSEHEVYREENNLANPNRPPASSREQRLVLLGGGVFVVLGVLAILRLPPFG